MRNTSRFLFYLMLVLVAACTKTDPPAPIGPLPSARHLAWHGLDYYAFIHFNMNTFTDMEWGTGGESPEQFNPTELDARQWARVAKEAGMKGIIITAKHHDGFCLWPTKTTGHSVINSPWKAGKGDLIKDLSEACKEFGLKFGVYLSPWDRNAANYGEPSYVDDFHTQLRELLTDYGEVFEVWFDGANGGSGYYGGANETRKIDNKTYYQWDKTTAIVRELQPNAVIFSDAGPDIRWVGTEEGFANETNWSIMRRDEIYPGWPRYLELRSGHEDGTHWLPAEVNTSIRPGWYYHPGEDHQVKTLPRLVRTYYESVGRNGNFLLNLPVDTRGLVHENDVAQLMALKKQIDSDFAQDLAIGQKITASDTRGNDPLFAPENAIDGKANTYWATNDGVTNAALTVAFEQPTPINRVLLQEFIELGQRVKKFTIAAEIDGNWQVLDTQTTIGFRRILSFSTVKASKLKVAILEAKGPVTIANMAIYRAPSLVSAPEIHRDKNGGVSLKVADKEVTVHYTLDGNEPDAGSTKYTGAFLIERPALMKAIAIDPESGRKSAVVTKRLDIPKKKWQVIQVSSGSIADGHTMIDEDENTFWATDATLKLPQEVVIDLGETYPLKGFGYWPNQERYPSGIITQYEFYVSADNRSWSLARKGEFANVLNNRIEQQVSFAKINARYIKLRAMAVAGESTQASFAEISIVTDAIP